MNDDAYERVEARIILESLGFDAERSNERSALVLLALLHLGPAEEWSEVSAPMLRTPLHAAPVRGCHARPAEPRRSQASGQLAQVVLSGPPAGIGGGPRVRKAELRIIAEVLP